MDNITREITFAIWNDYIAGVRYWTDNQVLFGTLPEDEQDAIVDVSADRVSDLNKLGFTADHATVFAANEPNEVRSMVEFDFRTLPAFENALTVQVSLAKELSGDDTLNLTEENVISIAKTAFEHIGLHR